MNATGVAIGAEPAADAATGRSGFLSIVIPCLNEELTIGEFVDWCFEGMQRAGIEGEVLIVDSSDDRSPQIAAEHGARVLTVPLRGLGRAYIDAIEHIRGEWVLLGDCDLTYDFRELDGFVQRLRAGDEFVMGTRTKGYVEQGAMPKLHRYFGSPATTWVFNRIYGTRFSDIHCGMRGMTLTALRRMALQSQGWEYASEMILKSSRLRLRCSEVPVRFYKDREGRESHLVRGGWTQPWKAGWATLRVQFLFAPDFFLWWPGWIMLTLGAALSVALAPGPIDLGSFSLDLHWMLLALVAVSLGYTAVQLATLARVHYDFDPAFSARARRLISYDRGVWTALTLTLLGLIPNVRLLIDWLANGLSLGAIDHLAVFGLELIILGFQTFAITLLLHLVKDPR